MKVGIIGLGRVAWQLEQDPLRNKPCTHWGAWRDSQDVVIAAGCDSDADKRQAFLAANPQAEVFADYRDMLGQVQPDLVSICAYADSRRDMLLASVQAGVKGIWCEKAMACSLQEADEMIAAIQAADTAMIVSFMRRWAPAYQQARRIINEGVLGTVETVNVHFSGNMLHTGTHAFDILRYWLGEAVGVQAWLEQDSAAIKDSGYRFEQDRPLEDFGGFALIRFENGARACIHAAAKDYFRFEFEVLGSRGMLRLGNAQQSLWLADESSRYAGFSELRERPFPEYEPHNMWQAARDDLLRSVAGAGQPLCSAWDGRQSLAIALAMHQSHHADHREISPDEVMPDVSVRSR